MIPDEAVEAAAAELALHMYHKGFEGMDAFTQNFLRKCARASLEAAAPHIRAQVLEDAAAKFGEAASWSESRPTPEQVQRWLRAGAAAERGSSGND